jgi:hypothetical protein
LESPFSELARIVASAARLGVGIERGGAILSAAEPHRNAVVHYLHPARYLRGPQDGGAFRRRRSWR